MEATTTDFPIEEEDFKMAKVKRYGNEEQNLWYFECLGCNCNHVFSSDAHTFNGNVDKPTIIPSILCTGNVSAREKDIYPHDSKPINCHSYITDGKIQYLGDCWHELKGQTIELPDLKENE